MNRIISLSVEDMYIKYTGEAFGATGSHNAVTLRMTFGPAWEGTAKTAYFTDALGNTSVALVLGLDTLVDGAYEVDVPSEALKTAGVATITIKGVLVSGKTTTKAITTAAGHFRVLDSELPDSAGNAGTITPSDKDQLQAEIAGMEALFTTAKVAAEAAAANAKVSETNAKASETAAASSASSAEASKTAAAESAATATAQASAADASAAKAAASQKAAQTAETNAKASETAAAASQASAETASASAQDSAAAAAKSAQAAQSASSTATNAASSADQAATAASGSASQAQASAAAAAQSAASVDGINKTAQSWAVGGTGTRPGEDTDNAKYWAQQAQAVAGGDFATKVEAQGYVSTHNQSVDAHADIRTALNGKEASGTAASAVTAHNEDSAAHADIREALADKEAAGAAAAVQGSLDDHEGNTTMHITANERRSWNAKAEKPKAVSVTLTAAGWDSSTKKQTVTVGGILADEATQRVLALPAVASAAAYRDDGICMTARENGTVTFSAKTVPSANLKVWVSWESVEDVTPPSASVAPQSGVLYTAGLSGLEASDVTAFAQAISNCSDVTNETTVVYVDFGSIHREISVGDQVTLPLNGTNYAFDVIGFNHDELTAPTAYGVATATGKAGITFQMHDLFGTYFAMNDSTTNVGGWKSSKMRTSTMVTMKGYLPAAWQTVIKPVNKASGTGGEFSRGTETVSDGCFLLAEVEIFGNTTYSVVGEGVQYAYYKAGNSKIKNRNGSADYWWERSPGFGDNISFCYVNEVGNVANIGANRTNCVAFGFCV